MDGYRAIPAKDRLDEGVNPVAHQLLIVSGHEGEVHFNVVAGGGDDVVGGEKPSAGGNL